MKAIQSLSFKIRKKSARGFALSQACASVAAIAAVFCYVIPAGTEMANGAAASYNATVLNRSLAAFKAAGGLVKRNASCSDVIEKLNSDDPVDSGSILTGPFIELRGNPIHGRAGWRVIYQDGLFVATDLPGELGVARF